MLQGQLESLAERSLAHEMSKKEKKDLDYQSKMYSVRTLRFEL